MLDGLKRKMEHLRLTHTLPRVVELGEQATREKQGPLEFFDRILSLEVEAREESRIATSLRLSGLPKGMTLDNFDFTFQPSVDKPIVDHLALGDWIRRKENVLLFGQPGVGKTHLAVALGVRAIELGYSVAYYTVDEVLQHLKKRQDTPVNRQRRSGYVKNALLILDELGYQAMDRRETHLFFQLISARYTKGSTIVTSNRSASEWVDIFGGDELATTALLDRLFHRAHLFNIDGRSYRLKDYDQALAQRIQLT